MRFGASGHSASQLEEQPQTAACQPAPVPWRACRAQASAVMRQAVKEGREGRGGKISEILKLDGMEGIERYVRSSMYYPEYRPTVFAF